MNLVLQEVILSVFVHVKTERISYGKNKMKTGGRLINQRLVCLKECISPATLYSRVFD